MKSAARSTGIPPSPSTLIGERINLRYDAAIPDQRRRLTILLDGKDCGTARKVDSYANTRVRRSDLNKDLSILPQSPGEGQNSEDSPSATDSSLAASRLPFLEEEDENE